MTNNLISKKRLDYLAPSHTIETVALTFDLHPDITRVTNVMTVRRILASANALQLDGEQLEFISLYINEREAQPNKDYVLVDDGIEILTNEDEFTLTIVNNVKPTENTSLEGLYFSNNAYCTQCEAQGFRKITYFLDRPDVLAVYTVTINSQRCDDTYLLSNGNEISDTGFVEGKRSCVWHDPHPKPSYLFALVAGHFDKLEDQYTTASGRHVLLQLFVDEGRLGQGQHALDSLKKAMYWDEQTYGLEYDLDIYMVVAVDFFNMGAMENKGLNVFNSKFVLADPNTATDEDYFNIESIIAHEYFHNWTGNRITCRDWFQLSLKEGLTVFRDQQFSADMSSPLITRIDQVKVMREHQFTEDASPMSHPIRPDEVMEMNNFYTVTVYDKGAEVIRMLHTLLNKQGFRKGMDEYFSRHDGQAVTCDDFVNAMQHANGLDLTHFKHWYSQSGTPHIKVEQHEHDGKTKLTFTQINKPTADQSIKQALYVPIKLECLTLDGIRIPIELENDTFILEQETQSLLINATIEDIVPSLLQDFSAPVKIEYAYTTIQLLTILRYSMSHYAKWEAAQSLFTQIILTAYYAEDEQARTTIEAIEQVALTIAQLDVPNEVLAKIMTLPSSEALFADIPEVNPLYLHEVRTHVERMLAEELMVFCRTTYDKLYAKGTSINYEYEKQQVNNRRLQNVCLYILALSSAAQTPSLILTQFQKASNMTDRLGALKAAQLGKDNLFDDLMLSFEQQFAHDAVVMDKWFALHAGKESEDILAKLDLLQAHQQYSMKNPNKVRSLIGSFAFYNTAGFHQESGAGYRYLCDYLIELDAINPQIASRLITPLIQLNRFAQPQREKMRAQLNRLYGIKNLSRDLFEKISKTLTA